MQLGRLVPVSSVRFGLCAVNKFYGGARMRGVDLPSTEPVNVSVVPRKLQSTTRDNKSRLLTIAASPAKEC